MDTQPQSVPIGPGHKSVLYPGTGRSFPQPTHLSALHLLRYGQTFTKPILPTMPHNYNPLISCLISL